jgi:predicted RNase H-like nuclease
MFGLEKRLLYKKGSVATRQRGQVQLARYIRGLSGSSAIKLDFEPSCTEILDEKLICTLRGKRLKQNEDALDSVICLYICALYAQSLDTNVCYGSAKIGYIYVPQVKCI